MYPANWDHRYSCGRTAERNGLPVGWLQIRDSGMDIGFLGICAMAVDDRSSVGLEDEG